MKILERAWYVLGTWLGLADPSDSHLTPSHGWLLPAADRLVLLRKPANDRPARGGRLTP
jgi:hypothetical protein